MDDGLSTLFAPKPPPSNMEAEQALLGVLMQFGERAFDRIGGTLRAEHFFHSGHGLIFQTIRSIVERGATPDLVTVTAALRDDKRFDDIGGRGYLGRVYAAASTIGTGPSLKLWAEDIVDRWKRRRALELADELANVANDGVDGTMDEAMAAVQRALDDVSSGAGSDTYKHISEYYREAMQSAEEASKRGGQVVGLPTGLADLDKTIGGLQAGDLIVCGARPGMGKSALGVCIALAAARSGATVGIWSLEMPGQQIGGRAAAIDTRIPYAALRAGRLEAEDWSRLLAAQKASLDLPIYVDPTPALRLSALASAARRIKRRHGLGLIVLDYIQLMRGDTVRRDGNKVQEVAEITAGLKAMAKDLNVPVLGFSQLNRGVEQRDEKRPLLSDLRDSGSIEQDADIVMFLYREEYYLQKEGEPKRRAGEDDHKFTARSSEYYNRLEACSGTGEIIVAKQRNGPEGVIRAAFNGEMMEYTNLYHGGARGPHS